MFKPFGLVWIGCFYGGLKAYKGITLRKEPESEAISRKILPT